MISYPRLRSIWASSRYKIVVLEQDKCNPFPEKFLINGMLFSSELYCKIYNYRYAMKANGVHLYAISVSGVIAELERAGFAWRVCAIGFPPSWTEEQRYNFGSICIPTKHSYIPKEFSV